LLYSFSAAWLAGEPICFSGPFVTDAWQIPIASSFIVFYLAQSFDGLVDHEVNSFFE